MHISILVISIAIIIVKSAECPKSQESPKSSETSESPESSESPEFWALSSCTENTSWKKSTSGAAIKSWINSFVPTLEKSRDVHSGLGAHFIEKNGIWRAQLIVQDTTKALSLAWKAFGQRPIDGWLYGTSRYLRPGQDEPEFSGPDIAYIYENFDIAIRGHFYQGVMLNATAAKISAFRCKNGLMELEFAKMQQSHDSSGSGFFSFVGQRSNSMKSLALEATDPLDRLNAYIATSDIAGEGLFANRDIGTGSVIVIYSGQLVTNVSQMLVGKSQEMQETLHKNFLTFNQTHTIDVPRPYDNLWHFRATLGHKANHNFTSNARFGFVKSPRFGETRCILATRNIAKGEEILVNYNYDMKKFVPKWYRDLYNEEFGQPLRNFVRNDL